MEITKLHKATTFVQLCSSSWRHGVPEVKKFADLLATIIEEELWREFDVGGIIEHRKSIHDFITLHPPKGLGTTVQDIHDATKSLDGHRLAGLLGVIADTLGKNGGDRHSDKAKKLQADNISLKHGTDPLYLTSRIKRDRPDIAERMVAGEFKSVRQAAIEAGIIKVKTPLQQVEYWWVKLTEQEQREFLASKEVSNGS